MRSLDPEEARKKKKIEEITLSLLSPRQRELRREVEEVETRKRVFTLLRFLLSLRASEVELGEEGEVVVLFEIPFSQTFFRLQLQKVSSDFEPRGSLQSRTSGDRTEGGEEDVHQSGERR